MREASSSNDAPKDIAHLLTNFHSIAEMASVVSITTTASDLSSDGQLRAPSIARSNARSRIPRRVTVERLIEANSIRMKKLETENNKPTGSVISTASTQPSLQRHRHRAIRRLEGGPLSATSSEIPSLNAFVKNIVQNKASCSTIGSVPGSVPTSTPTSVSTSASTPAPYIRPRTLIGHARNASDTKPLLSKPHSYPEDALARDQYQCWLKKQQARPQEQQKTYASLAQSQVTFPSLDERPPLTPLLHPQPQRVAVYRIPHAALPPGRVNSPEAWELKHGYYTQGVPYHTQDPKCDRREHIPDRCSNEHPNGDCFGHRCGSRSPPLSDTRSERAFTMGSIRDFLGWSPASEVGSIHGVCSRTTTMTHTRLLFGSLNAAMALAPKAEEMPVEELPPERMPPEETSTDRAQAAHAPSVREPKSTRLRRSLHNRKAFQVETKLVRMSEHGDSSKWTSMESDKAHLIPPPSWIEKPKKARLNWWRHTAHAGKPLEDDVPLCDVQRDPYPWLDLPEVEDRAMRKGCEGPMVRNGRGLVMRVR